MIEALTSDKRQIDGKVSFPVSGQGPEISWRLDERFYGRLKFEIQFFPKDRLYILRERCNPDMRSRLILNRTSVDKHYQSSYIVNIRSSTFSFFDRGHFFAGDIVSHFGGNVFISFSLS